MNRKRTAFVALLVSIVLMLSAVGLPALAQEGSLNVGDQTTGFVVRSFHGWIWSMPMLRC